MDALDEKRHQIYKRRYPYKPALTLLKIIEENETRASYYKEGSLFYAPYYEKWKEAAEALIQNGYTIGQITEIKEAFQTELAAIAKAKRELKKEESLINGILSERSRVQTVEITAPEAEPPSKVQENTKEADTAQKEIYMGKVGGGDAEKTELIQAEIPDHTEKQPAYNEKQKQPEQAR